MFEPPGGGDDAAERAGDPLLALTMTLAIEGALLHAPTSLWPPAIAPRLLSAGEQPAWRSHKRAHLKMKWLETFAIVLVTPELNGLTMPVNLQVSRASSRVGQAVSTGRMTMRARLAAHCCGTASG